MDNYTCANCLANAWNWLLLILSHIKMNRSEKLEKRNKMKRGDKKNREASFCVRIWKYSLFNVAKMFFTITNMQYNDFFTNFNEVQK
mmetsp:Transcript_5162/g.15033  ORF Transcript_5162/g.15033 Transcript_5162/m.15033 type:complete len:87 (-) Transcript_5162:265-525(-)